MGQPAYEDLKEFFQYVSKNQDEKTNLVKYLAKARGIKEASARRNINRAINYYLETGKQARSAKTYLNTISEYLAERMDVAIASGEFVGEFPDLEAAENYIEGLENILEVVYDGEFRPIVIRSYSEVSPG